MAPLVGRTNARTVAPRARRDAARTATRESRLLRGGVPLCWAAAAACLLPPAAEAFDHTHAAFTALLRAHVRGARVAYAALQADPKPLNRYLASLGAVSKAEFDTWPKAERLAFLINAYNAFTLKLVVDHYPVSSIKRIGPWFSSPWTLHIVRLWGTRLTLDDLEHGLLRRDYGEPRIHFALVCAAISCPPLRPEAYRGADLNAQLDDQGRAFLADRSRNRFDPARRQAALSAIFKWFREDFGKDEDALLARLAPLAPPDAAAALRKPGWSVSYLPYDWSLNSD
jgi:hypothetical protein